MTDLTREQIIERAITLLESAAQYGIEVIQEGMRTPNSRLCEETAKLLRSLSPAEGCVVVPFDGWWSGFAPTVYHGTTYPRKGWMVDVARAAYRAGRQAAPPAAAGRKKEDK